MREVMIKDVKWHPKTNKISQIPKEGLEFAMLSAGYEQLNQLVWCKDFMQDIIWSYVNNTPIEIYGFKYNPKEEPAPSLNRIRLLITNYKDPELSNKVQNNLLPLLHSVEDRLKMSRTILEKCRTTPPIYKKSGVWILNGSKRWLKASPMVSLYTLLVRVGLVHNSGDALETTIQKIINKENSSYFDNKNRDGEMLSNALKGIQKIMKYTDNKIFPADLKKNYPIRYGTGIKSYDFSIFTMHDRCGIVGFSKKETEQYFPNWK